MQRQNTNLSMVQECEGCKQGVRFEASKPFELYMYHWVPGKLDSHIPSLSFEVPFMNGRGTSEQCKITTACLTLAC